MEVRGGRGDRQRAHTSNSNLHEGEPARGSLASAGTLGYSPNTVQAGGCSDETDGAGGGAGGARGRTGATGRNGRGRLQRDDEAGATGERRVRGAGEASV